MVVWIIGLSGAGKSTLAQEVVALARKFRPNIALIDGDTIREVFGNDLGHTIVDRRKNADRICRLCKFLNDQGIDVVCAILSLFHESQEWNRENLKDYFEVYIDAPFDTLVKRDHKGLYRKALVEGLRNVVGVDLKFTPPRNPHLTIINEGGIESLLSFAPKIASTLTG